MANYAVGAVLAAALRARDPRGARRLAGRRPGLVRVGARRDLPLRAGAVARDVLHEVLGGPPTADALLAEIGRAARRRDVTSGGQATRATSSASTATAANSSVR